MNKFELSEFLGKWFVGLTFGGGIVLFALEGFFIWVGKRRGK